MFPAAVCQRASPVHMSGSLSASPCEALSQSDGGMFPATVDQFNSFLSSKLTKQLFIETWEIIEGIECLVCVAVTDVLNNALSAVYTFYHPDMKKSGLGVFSILRQIKLCQEMKLDYLYLGYQIDDCKKMNYKTKYYPHERFISGQWQAFANKSSVVIPNL